MFFLKQKSNTFINLRAYFNYIEGQFATKIMKIYTDKGSKYISNEFNDFFLMGGVLHELTPHYSLEFNAITEYFNQIMDTIAQSMIIPIADFLCL
jgi:hypothetical protein